MKAKKTPIKIKKTTKKQTFSEFFRTASPEEKRAVIMKAAQESNRMQRELMRKAGVKL